MSERWGLPTVHNGVQYDSRTEVRFAIVANALGLHLKREPGLLKVGVGAGGKAIWYAPDFLETAWGIHIEVKPGLEAMRGHTPELRKPFGLAKWPMPVLIWFFDDEYGVLMDGRYASARDRRMGYFAQFARCTGCNAPVIVASRLDDDEYDSVTDQALEDAIAEARALLAGIDRVDDDPGSAAITAPRLVFGHPTECDGEAQVDWAPSAAFWRRAMALARGWRADA